MHDVIEPEMEPLPVTLTNVDVTYAQSLFHYEEKAVAIIDENRLYGALVRSYTRLPEFPLKLHGAASLNSTVPRLSVSFQISTVRYRPSISASAAWRSTSLCG